jgi:hypothetical protein
MRGEKYHREYPCERCDGWVFYSSNKSCVQCARRREVNGGRLPRLPSHEARRQAADLGKPLYVRPRPCRTCGGKDFFTSNGGCVSCGRRRSGGSGEKADACQRRKTARSSKEKFYEGKPCSKCEQTLRYTSTGTCVECTRTVWRQVPKKVRLVECKKRFGAQGSRCAACGRQESLKWCLDHDHETGKLRGVLCDTCNRTLGHSKECVDRLIRVAAYILSWTTANELLEFAA